MEGSTATQMEFVERRRCHRLAGDFDAEIVLLSGPKVGDQVVGKIINISREGLGVVLPSDIEANDRLNFVIYSEDDSSLCDGRIVWRKEIQGRFVYGVKILNWTYMDAGLERSLPRG